MVISYNTIYVHNRRVCSLALLDLLCVSDWCEHTGWLVILFGRAGKKGGGAERRSKEEHVEVRGLKVNVTNAFTYV